MENTQNTQPSAEQQTVSEALAAHAIFLSKSGWTFNVIGIIAFIIGLLVGIDGIWITGCAAMLSGCYLLVKSHQYHEKSVQDKTAQDK